MAHVILAAKLATTCLGVGFWLLLVPGCASDRMDPGAEEMSAALSAANGENERHAEACREAASSEAMMADLTRHDETMGGLMAQMDDACGQMQGGSMMSMHCSGAGLGRLSSSLASMHAGMAEHAERMHAATTLDAERSECATHTDAMREMMRGMVGDLDSMSCMGQ